MTVGGITAAFRGTGLLSYENPSISTLGSETLRQLILSPAMIGIRGAREDLVVNASTGEQLSRSWGLFSPAPLFLAGEVIYDATDCNGEGHYLEGEVPGTQ